MARISSPTPRKSFKRYVVEFLVIFISVVLAFFIENLRESMNEKSQYKEAMFLFGSDLDEQTQALQEQVDTIRIVGHNGIGGYYEELKEYIWFDSLLKTNSATMDHFRYMIENDYIFQNYIPLVIKSPLAKEIRLKYAEHSSGRIVRKHLLTYERAMEVLAAFEDKQNVVYENINSIISRTNHNLQFSNRDSLLLYSNEFRWNLERLVELKQWDYNYRKSLGYVRFVRIMEGLLEEATMFNFLIPEDKLCFRMKDRKERHACWWGNEPEDMVLVRVDDIIKEKRDKYFSKQLN